MANLKLEEYENETSNKMSQTEQRHILNRVDKKMEKLGKAVTRRANEFSSCAIRKATEQMETQIKSASKSNELKNESFQNTLDIVKEFIVASTGSSQKMKSSLVRLDTDQGVLSAKLDDKLTLLRKSLTQRYYHIQQILRQLKIYPKRFHLPTYDIGAEANPAHFAPIITNEITILEIKELKLSDAAFVLSLPY